MSLNFVLKDVLSWQAVERLSLDGVILSTAKDLLFARIVSEADPSIAQNRRDLRMTWLRVFPSPGRRMQESGAKVFRIPPLQANAAGLSFTEPALDFQTAA
jgi:hypothetical protein